MKNTGAPKGIFPSEPFFMLIMISSTDREGVPGQPLVNVVSTFPIANNSFHHFLLSTDHCSLVTAALRCSLPVIVDIPFRHDHLAEGVYTVKALMDLSSQYGVDLPIASAVHAVLYENKPISECLDKLFMRSIKKEF